MFVVGVTGGIGSGKSAATDAFAQLGIDIIDADIASRNVVALGSAVLRAIAAHFGQHILLDDGSLNRAALRRIVFENSAEKSWLEQLLHPLIGMEVQRLLMAATSPYVVFVSPLLVESQQDRICDRILVIDVPEEIQLQRTMQRDGNDAAQVQRIIATQASRQQRLQCADDIIENTGSLTHLQQEVAKLHAQYLKLAQAKLKGDGQ
jgi:dephospho-CoA kinase